MNGLRWSIRTLEKHRTYGNRADVPEAGRSREQVPPCLLPLSGLGPDLIQDGRCKGGLVLREKATVVRLDRRRRVQDRVARLFVRARGLENVGAFFPVWRQQQRNSERTFSLLEWPAVTADRKETNENSGAPNSHPTPSAMRVCG